MTGEKEVDTMKRVRGNALSFSLAGIVLFAVAAAGESTAPEMKRPNGTIQVATKSIALGVGVTWGDGTLTFEGKEHAFAVKGLSLTDLGMGDATVKGNVYNLSKLEDFAGKYTVTEPNFELGGTGPPWSRFYSGMILANDKGVFVQIWVVRAGPHLRLIDNAVEVSLK
jgi:hypothetical protein